MTFRLQMSDFAKAKALEELDALYAKRVHQILGPLAHLHAMKLAQAQAGGGSLVPADECEGVIAAAALQQAQLAGIDRRRLALKARLRAAQSNAEIAVVLAEAKQP